MKLRPPSYLVLGMLRLGPTSGYAIKKLADISTRVFFPTSLAQVYPELARLERGGFVVRRDDPHGGRRRLAYAITERGEEALLSWLRSERLVAPHTRDEGLLRLFFADALPADDQLVLVRTLRDRARAAGRWMHADVLPTAQAFEASGSRHVHTVARFGVELYEFVADWLDRLADELERETPPPGA